MLSRILFTYDKAYIDTALGLFFSSYSTKLGRKNNNSTITLDNEPYVFGSVLIKL